ncbi:MAG: Ig-like domain-containing protein [Lachnospiraceae bacterium]|nr:Ig-like domain-containing protein [Lachnospiraceae bacterium]
MKNWVRKLLVFALMLSVCFSLPGVRAQAATRESVEKKADKVDTKIAKLTAKLEKATGSDKKNIEKELKALKKESDAYQKALNATFKDAEGEIKLEIAKGKKSAQTPALTEKKYNKIIWKSSDTSIATVSKKGVIKGVSLGEAVITATASVSGAQYVIKVNVYSNVRNVESLVFEEEEYTLKTNDYKDTFFIAKAVVTPADANEKIKVEVEDETVAKYSAKNNPGTGQFAFKLKKAGKTEVTFTGANGELASLTLNVTSEKNIKKIKLDKKIKLNTVTGKFDIGFTVKPADYTEEPEWIYNEEILKLVDCKVNDDGNGIATFEIVDAHDTEVTVKTLSGLKSTCQIVFSKKDIPITDIAFTQASFAAAGDSFQLTYTQTPFESKEPLTWKIDGVVMKSVENFELMDEWYEEDPDLGAPADATAHIAYFEIESIEAAKSKGSVIVTVETKSGATASCTVVF